MNSEQLRLMRDSRISDAARLIGLHLTTLSPEERAALRYVDLCRILHGAPPVRRVLRGLRELALFGYPSMPLPVRLKPSAELRAHLLARYDHACVWCGSGEDLQIDHRIPVAQGGGNEEENLRVLCATCNRKKASRLDEEVLGSDAAPSPAFSRRRPTSPPRPAPSRASSPRTPTGRRSPSPRCIACWAASVPSCER